MAILHNLCRVAAAGAPMRNKEGDPNSTQDKSQEIVHMFLRKTENAFQIFEFSRQN